ncbi:hypothetical protein R3X25_00670 [Lutibacter sp. TH_r2]|uniref:hypothetical protein n=1 Tax=Lutibacter sp. TH_r2 TaxID=3082083 RepID=UPI002952F695|nr:hypothetical protein [Lutibacter sp. TH_r2]MDV7185778.1 hypothetical protein [Lutibacter sp. TH_r2]
MIKYLKRSEIDIEKYNNCVEKSFNSRVFAFSWYLDIVADNWDVLVLNDYEAVMPLPWREKYFIKYVYCPFWVIELGIYSFKNNVELDSFLQKVFENFKYSNLRMNADNVFNKFSENRHKKQLQYIDLEKGYNNIFKAYSRNRKRDLKKANDFNLVAEWNTRNSDLVNLFKNNVGVRVKDVKDKDYNRLLKLLNECVARNVGELLSIFDENGNLIASSFFLKHKNKVTELVCSTDFKNRNNGANTFFNDEAIKKYSKEFKIFNFGGSSMKNISNYYKSFGAETENYCELNYNNLPKLIKYFKK